MVQSVLLQSFDQPLDMGPSIAIHVTLVDASLSGGLSRSFGFSAVLFGSDDACFPFSFQDKLHPFAQRTH